MRPGINFLDINLKEKIVSEAVSILTDLGVEIDSKAARNLLTDHGAEYDAQTDRVKYTQEIIEKALKSTVTSFNLYDIFGNQATDFRDSKIHFTPGSSALYVLDGETGKGRKPLTEDYIRYAKVTEQLPALNSQSTAMVCSDVPEEVSDSYRLYLSLMHGSKPTVTGTFSSNSLNVMMDFQKTIRGSKQDLKAKPLTMFTCCPTSPLKWSEESIDTVLACGENGVPIEIIPMPLAGFISPVTIVGTLIQHTAEILSGLVISQIANPGTPILFGSSAAIFDVRHETTPLGAPESMMLACSVNELGKHLGLPTQAYISLTDSKTLDAQAGSETGMGAVLAGMSGINNISGPGMIDFQSCHSTEKLILDNDICNMVHKMTGGVKPNDDFPALPLMQELVQEKHLIIADHTRAKLKTEQYVPGKIIDRTNHARWTSEGEKSLKDRAKDQVHKLIESYNPPETDENIKNELTKLMLTEAKKYGMDKLPGHN